MFEVFDNREIVAHYNEVSRDAPSISGQDIDGSIITAFTEWESNWWTYQDGLMVVDQRPNSYNLTRNEDQIVASRTNEATQVHQLGQTGLRPLLEASGIMSEAQSLSPGHSLLMVRYASLGQFLTNTNAMLNDPNATIRPPVRFKVYDEDEYPADLFIDHFGNQREVLTALTGWHSRHDVIAHDVAWLALTESMVDAAQDKAKKIYDLPSGEVRTAAIDAYMRTVDFGIFRPKILKILTVATEHEHLWYAKDLAKLTGRTPQKVIQELREHVANLQQ